MNNPSPKVVQFKQKQKDIDILLLSRSKKTIREVKDSFKFCQVGNHLRVRENLNNISSRKVTKNVDLLIIDSDSYPENWKEMVRLAKEMNELKCKGVIVISSFSDEQMLFAAKEAGASNYLVKPFDMIDIHQMIRPIKGIKVYLRTEEGHG